MEATENPRAVAFDGGEGSTVVVDGRGVLLQLE
jgi:hypothetical protein